MPITKPLLPKRLKHNVASGANGDKSQDFISDDIKTIKPLERLALPARAGFAEQGQQTLNPPLGFTSTKVWANARTYPVHAVLGACDLSKIH